MGKRFRSFGMDGKDAGQSRSEDDFVEVLVLDAKHMQVVSIRPLPITRVDVAIFTNYFGPQKRLPV